MNSKLNALEKVAAAAALLRQAQDEEAAERERFADVCREAYNEGANDREMHEVTGYSRARIQQFRSGKTTRKA